MSVGAAAELVELAESVFGSAVDGDGLDGALWATLEETGLARLTLPESVGGSGGTLADLAAVLGAAGAFAARVPLVETDLLGGWLLHAAGLPVPAGPLTAVVGDLRVQPTGGGATVSGTLQRVPWARVASGIVVLSGEHVALLDPAAVTLTEGVNLAEEPRDEVVVVDVTLAADTIAQAPAEAAEQLRSRAALGRALLLAGAARGALAQAVRYAGERVQFGRPIAKFQAIQQQLALAAAEVAAAGAAAEAAAGVVQRCLDAGSVVEGPAGGEHSVGGVSSGRRVHDGFVTEESLVAIAAAKARASEAAGAVARIAHQVHGALGFTREHSLRLLTTRLWAWRDEDGAEAQWHADLGARALAAGPDGLWPLITGTP